MNKFIREKFTKEEKKLFQQENIYQETGNPIPGTDNENSESLELIKDELYHERSVVRCLIEFGLKEWEPGKTVADYLLNECLDDDSVEEPMLKKIISTYKTWYEEKLEPIAKNFLYSEDLQMSNAVVNMIEFPYEVSDGWLQKYEMPVPTREENYKKDITSSFRYLELKKIKKLINMNAEEIEKTSSTERQMLLIQTHAHLKNMEMQLTREIGMVIMK